MTAAPSRAHLAGWPGFTAARDRAVHGLRGRVLEIGAGTGANFAQLAPGVEWLGLEPSARRRRTLAANARRFGHRVPPSPASAERIPLPDASVDGVLATTVLCSVRSPAQVLDEVARVLTPGGRLVLAEHVIAPEGSLERRLQRLARPWTRWFDHGCDPTRDTGLAVRHSRLEIRSVERFEVPVLGRLAVPFLVLVATRPPARTEDRP